jgi:NADH-quinone oxidoreductase subunit C
MSEKTFLTRLQDSKIHEFILDVRGYAGETTIEVKESQLHKVLQFLKTNFGFHSLADITATDHYTDQGRFEVAYNIVNMADRQRLRVSCRIEEDDPTVDSAVDIWGSSEWYEREAFDMMGIKFRNHPDLRRIYMPEDFQYFPLRKEFPQLGIPGSIQMPEKDPPKEYK